MHSFQELAELGKHRDHAYHHTLAARPHLRHFVPRSLFATNPVAAGECAFAAGHDRLSYALVDQWIDSYKRAPASVTLNIDDTCDVLHGHQQLSLFAIIYAG